MSFTPPLNGSEGLNKRWKNENYSELLPLRKKLLNIGGDEVVPMEEIHLDLLLERGHIIEHSSRRTVEGGIDSRCHQNSAFLYQENEEITHIGTGWCLSPDSLWRQHSWGMVDNEIIETTVKRDIYYGVLLKGQEAEDYIKSIKMY